MFYFYAVAAVSKIPGEMQKLVKWYNENEKKLHPIELAATLHQRFVFIHPFVDGNGRMSDRVTFWKSQIVTSNADNKQGAPNGCPFTVNEGNSFLDKIL